MIDLYRFTCFLHPHLLKDNAKTWMIFSLALVQIIQSFACCQSERKTEVKMRERSNMREISAFWQGKDSN